jgi:hypothetical protein
MSPQTAESGLYISSLPARASLYYPSRRLFLVVASSRTDFYYIPLLHFSFLLVWSIGLVMAPSTLFALVALATTTYVAGQTTAAPASAAVPTFPTTPLVSEHFPYSALVRILCSPYLPLF